MLISLRKFARGMFAPAGSLRKYLLLLSAWATVSVGLEASRCSAQTQTPLTAKSPLIKTPSTGEAVSGDINHYERVTRELVVKTNGQQRMLRLQLLSSSKFSLDGSPIPTAVLQQLSNVAVRYDTATNVCSSIEASSFSEDDKNEPSDARSRKTLPGARARLTRSNGFVLDGRLVSANAYNIVFNNNGTMLRFRPAEVKSIGFSEDSYVFNAEKKQYQSQKWLDEVARRADLAAQERDEWSVQEREARKLGVPLRQWLIKHDEEVRFAKAMKKMVVVVLADWYAHTRKVTIKDFLKGKGPTDVPTLGEEIANALSLRVRDEMLDSALRDLFQELDTSELNAQRRIVFLYLESREILNNLKQDALDQWCLDELKKIFDGKSPESAVHSAEFAKFMAELHKRVQDR
jgi:hypothetical protein